MKGVGSMFQLHARGANINRVDRGGDGGFTLLLNIFWIRERRFDESWNVSTLQILQLKETYLAWPAIQRETSTGAARVRSQQSHTALPGR